MPGPLRGGDLTHTVDRLYTRHVLIFCPLRVEGRVGHDTCNVNNLPVATVYE